MQIVGYVEGAGEGEVAKKSFNGGLTTKHTSIASFTVTAVRVVEKNNKYSIIKALSEGKNEKNK